jgi:hypothetical protein
VSCASADSCTLVGAFGIVSSQVGSPLAEHWDGSAWTVQTVPAPAGSKGDFVGLSAVSCASPASCTAVGNYGSPASPNKVPLAEHWNSSTWKIQKLPGLGGGFTWLSGVSCFSGTDCTAVGFTDTAALAEHWNGSSWKIQKTPGAGFVFNGVSCAAASRCTAVGQSAAGTLAEAWDGSTWTVQPTPSPGQSPSLTGISCVSPVNCTAVGYSSKGPLAERWNGKKWLVETTAPGTGLRNDSLQAVSCLTGGFCSAAGSQFHRISKKQYYFTPIDESKNG